MKISPDYGGRSLRYRQSTTLDGDWSRTKMTLRDASRSQ